MDFINYHVQSNNFDNQSISSTSSIRSIPHNKINKHIKHSSKQNKPTINLSGGGPPGIVKKHKGGEYVQPIPGMNLQAMVDQIQSDIDANINAQKTYEAKLADLKTQAECLEIRRECINKTVQEILTNTPCSLTATIGSNISDASNISW